MSPPEIDTVPTTASGGASASQEELPVTLFSCQWNVPRKRMNVLQSLLTFHLESMCTDVTINIRSDL